MVRSGAAIFWNFGVNGVLLTGLQAPGNAAQPAVPLAAPHHQPHRIGGAVETSPTQVSQLQLSARAYHRILSIGWFRKK